MKIFEKHDDKFMTTEYQQKTLLGLVEDFSFVKSLKHFTFSEKVELLKCFKVRKVNAGTRFFAGSDKIDSFNLLMRGKIGVLYPDLQKIKQLSE